MRQRRVLRADRSPLLPPESRGRPIASVGFVWAGERALEPELLRALRALGRPLAERVEQLTYLGLQRMDDAQHRHGVRRYCRRHHCRPTAAPSPASRTPRAHSATATRRSNSSPARWTDPAEDQQRMSAARRYGASLEPFATGMYVNAMSDEGSAGIARAYAPAKLALLRALKLAYDPGNVFHLNQNITPG